MKIRTLAQLAAIALVWGAAYLDLKQPGHMQFYDPIPWQAIDSLRGDWGTCPEMKGAIAVPGIPRIAKFFSFPTSLNHWQTRLGEPLCHSTTDETQTYVWAIANKDNLYIRITFNSEGKATSYEFFHSTRSSPDDRQPQPGSPVPALGEESTQI